MKDVRFSYKAGEEVLHGVSLSVPQGTFTALVGPSGSGKSTLTYALNGIVPHCYPGDFYGSVVVDGLDTCETALTDLSRVVGSVCQDVDSQFVTSVVEDEILYGLENFGVPRGQIEDRVAQALADMGIPDLRDRVISSLSGGQKQKVAIASILAMRPKVLVLDEPTAQLDPVSAGAFFQMLRRINQELGVTVILSEHRLEQLYATVDQVVVLADGKLHANGNPEQVARQLKEGKSDLLPMLPAPVQISSAVTGGAACPMTVRAGRLWLEQWAEGRTVPPVKMRKTPESENNEPVLELKDVWYRYDKDGQDVLRGVTFTVTQGSFCALTGGNGSGKSTLLKSICGLCKPYRGWVKVQGKKLGKYGKGELFQQRLALLPQNPKQLFVGKTVEEDLLELGTPAQAQAMAQSMGITDLLSRHPYDLSGGELQKAALAKVLLLQPKILLLDEPTKGLDAFYKEQLAQLLLRFQAEGGTILMVSHDVEFSARFATHAALFFDGDVTAVQIAGQFFAGNQFYTTAAARMSRTVFPDAVTNEEVIARCSEMV